jgi:Mrp family chromosome partitioning ATPase
MTVPVLTAVAGPREADLVAGLERSRGEVRVARRCVDLAELLSAAASGLGRAAVVSADLYRLDREAVVQLRHAGVAVVGLAEPDDEEARRRLEGLGVGRVLPADIPGEDLAGALVEAVQDLAARSRDPRTPAAPGLAPSDADALRERAVARWTGADPADALDDLPVLPDDDPPPVRLPGARTGRIVAVWGPIGSPGRTTVAASLAGELARRGAQTLLVDADTYGPSVAQSLGLLDESGGIAGAVRAANTGALDLDRLARLAPSIWPTLRVLTGLPQPSRWPELRPSGLDTVWERARELSRWTVVDCGFCLEADEELSFDTAAPRRNGATLSALAAADVVLVVGSADPVGLQRLVRGVADLTDALGPAAAPRVVVTKVRAAAVGPSPERRVVEALGRYAGIDEPWLVPDDRAACDAAMLAGRLLVEVAPGSPARRALAELAADLEERLLVETLDASV